MPVSRIGARYYPLTNLELFSYEDENYNMTFPTDTTGSNQSEVIFSTKIDMTHVHAVRYLCIGKKNTDASSDNDLILDTGAQTKNCGTWTDTNEAIQSGWGVSTARGTQTLKLFTDGGNDAQKYKLIKIWLVRDST